LLAVDSGPQRFRQSERFFYELACMREFALIAFEFCELIESNGLVRRLLDFTLDRKGMVEAIGCLWVLLQLAIYSAEVGESGFLACEVVYLVSYRGRLLFAAASLFIALQHVQGLAKTRKRKPFAGAILYLSTDGQPLFVVPDRPFVLAQIDVCSSEIVEHNRFVDAILQVASDQQCFLEIFERFLRPPKLVEQCGKIGELRLFAGEIFQLTTY